MVLRDVGVSTPLRDFGIPPRFFEHMKRPELIAEIGLTAQEISRQVVEAMARFDASSEQQHTDTSA